MPTGAIWLNWAVRAQRADPPDVACVGLFGSRTFVGAKPTWGEDFALWERVGGDLAAVPLPGEDGTYSVRAILQQGDELFVAGSDASGPALWRGDGTTFAVVGRLPAGARFTDEQGTVRTVEQARLNDPAFAAAFERICAWDGSLWLLSTAGYHRAALWRWKDGGCWGPMDEQTITYERTRRTVSYASGGGNYALAATGFGVFFPGAYWQTGTGPSIRRTWLSCRTRDVVGHYAQDDTYQPVDVAAFWGRPWALLRKAWEQPAAVHHEEYWLGYHDGLRWRGRVRLPEQPRIAAHRSFGEWAQYPVRWQWLLVYGQRLHVLGAAMDERGSDGVWIARVTYDPPLVYGPVLQRVGTPEMRQEFEAWRPPWLYYGADAFRLGGEGLLRPASNGIRTATWLSEYYGGDWHRPVLE